MKNSPFTFNKIIFRVFSFLQGWQSVLTRKKLFQDINQNFIIWNKKKFKVFNNKINLMSTIHTIYSISTRIHFSTCDCNSLLYIPKDQTQLDFCNGPKLIFSVISDQFKTAHKTVEPSVWLTIQAIENFRPFEFQLEK